MPSTCTGSASPAGSAYGICTSSGRGCNFGRNGASRAAPLVVAAYGPIADARPLFISINAATFGMQGGNGQNVVALHLEFAGGDVFWDYTNATYNPGFITATATAASGQNQVVMPSPPPSNLINAANSLDWALYNFSNITAMQSQTSCTSMVGRINSISGSTLTLLNNIPTSYDIAIGDELVYLPFTCGNGGFSLGPNIVGFGYVEGLKVRGAPIGINPLTQPQTVEYYVRRNVVVDSASVGNRNQGIFIGDTHSASSTILVEENLTDHTGWRQYDPDCAPGQFLPAKCNGVASTQFYNFQGNPNNQSQGAYDHEDWGTANFYRNIMTNAAGSGSQVRSGGTVYNNFFGQNSTQATGGGIVVANNASYNVFANSTINWQGIMTATGVAGNVLTFAHVPQSLNTTGNNQCQPFNASNPSGISQTTNTSFTITPTTMTIAGPAVSVNIGDTIYCVGRGANFAAFGYSFDSTWTTPGTLGANTANPSDVQWNINTGTLPIAYIGGASAPGWSYGAVGSVARATGNVFANNWLMNQPGIGVLDQSLIVSVGTSAFCGTKVAIGVPQNGVSFPWHAGDSIVISGTLPSTMNANGSWVVDSYDNSTSPASICLAASTFGTGTWTAGTGVINGGVAWSNNHYYNVTGTLVSSTTAGGTSGAIASLSSFTPVTTTGCPQAANCPSPEGYAINSGLGTTMAEIIACARLNRLGAWDTRCTAPPMNNHIRQYTDASIPRPAL